MEAVGVWNTPTSLYTLQAVPPLLLCYHLPRLVDIFTQTLPQDILWTSNWAWPKMNFLPTPAFSYCVTKLSKWLLDNCHPCPLPPNQVPQRLSSEKSLKPTRFSPSPPTPQCYLAHPRDVAVHLLVSLQWIGPLKTILYNAATISFKMCVSLDHITVYLKFSSFPLL